MRRRRTLAAGIGAIAAATAIAAHYTELPSSAAEEITAEDIVDAGVSDIVDLPPIPDSSIGLDAPLDRKE